MALLLMPPDGMLQCFILTLGGYYRRQEGLPRRDGRHEGAGILVQTRRDCVQDHRLHTPSGEYRACFLATSLLV